jgi:DNA-binding XRE family transcriptional regulator
MSRLSKEDAEEGTIAVLLKRAVEKRIPNVLAVRDRLEKGGTLSNLEITHLEEILANSQKMQEMVERHPEFQELAAKMINLYAEITRMAVENEEKGEVKPEIDLSE